MNNIIITVISHWSIVWYHATYAHCEGKCVVDVSLMMKGVSLMMKGVSLMIRGVSLMIRGMSLMIRGVSLMIRGVSLMMRGVPLMMKGVLMIATFLPHFFQSSVSRVCSIIWCHLMVDRTTALSLLKILQFQVCLQMYFLPFMYVGVHPTTPMDHTHGLCPSCNLMDLLACQ